MPSRVIRGEINRSESLSRVSPLAELTFDRLLTAVDDFGRTDARPAALKADLFPLREEHTPERILEWIGELVDEGCVRLYEVDGRPYLQMTGWEKHRGAGRRSKASKYPEVEENQESSRNSQEILGSAKQSEEKQEDPPGGSGTRDEGRGTRSRDSGASAPATLPVWALKSSELLIKRLREVPGARIPPRARNSWAKEIAKIPEECPQDFAGECVYADVLEAAIRWALGPENLGAEYEVVIRSGGSLRTKWPKLTRQAQRARAQTKSKEDFDAHLRTLAHG